jgi:hypothetical protein
LLTEIHNSNSAKTYHRVASGLQTQPVVFQLVFLLVPEQLLSRSNQAGHLEDFLKGFYIFLRGIELSALWWVLLITLKPISNRAGQTGESFS